MSHQPNHSQSQTQRTSGLSIVVRLLWLLVGNGTLLFLAIFIAQARARSLYDLFFWATVGALVLIRYIDITQLNGTTADGEPASLRHWYRYVVLLLLISGALWALAHTVLRSIFA